MSTTTQLFEFTVSDVGSTFKDEIRAVNPPQARRFAEARYPSAKLFGFNAISGSSQN